MAKRKKEFKLSPVLVFLILTLIVMIISGIGGLFKLETGYYKVNLVTGDLESQLVKIDSLFNRTGLQFLISNMISNFINFAPLGMLITGLLGVGVAHKSGFLTALFTLIASDKSKKAITFVVVLLGIITSMFYDVGYVILIPLSAILFITIERNPLGGICAAFAGITFGYGANFFVNGLDSSLIGYTKSATGILDKNYLVHLSGNFIFIVVSTIILAYVGMYITEKYIIPKIGKYNFDEVEEPFVLGKREKKALMITLGTVGILILLTIYCIIPGLPFSGLLLDLKQSTYVEQLFSYTSYFNQGVVVIVSVLLMIAGLIYGLRVRSIKNNHDFVNGMNYYLNNISSILVLIFFAAQFMAIFKKTNIGIFITATLADLIGRMQLSGMTLILVAFIIVIISSIFLPSASTKWAILSPVLVPMFMQVNMTPEFAQAVFRAGDSAIKGITPFFMYFVILIGFLQIYNKKKDHYVSITDAMSLMVPYTIAFSIVWLLIILGFYIIGIPLGINTGPIF